VADLANILLAETPAERLERLRQVDVAELEQAIPELGRQHILAAAEVLRLIDAVVADRGLRKAARRELHRLESMGIHAPQVLDLQAEAEVEALDVPHGPSVLVSEAWATEISPSGLRAVWLLGEPPLGGAWLAAMALSEDDGLTELSLVETTRKRYQRELEERRNDPRGTWVPVPPDYALQLVREAVDTAHRRDRGLPTRYRSFKELFGEAEHAPEQALVHRMLSQIETPLHADSTNLEATIQLFREPEVVDWYVPVGEDLRTRASEVARGAASGLVVPGNTSEQRAVRLLSDAAREALTPERRHALQRRLEETAYIFVATDRLGAAHLAVAAARAVTDASIGPDRNPFLRLLLTSGLVGGVRTESHRATAERLLDLVLRGLQSESGHGLETTTPSGLILPR
jgi:hypothetical protein